MKALSAIVVAVLAVSTQLASAGVPSIDMQKLSIAMASVHPMNIINWKVGESASYDINTGFFPGTMTKSVTKEEGNAVWVHQDMDLLIQKDSSDMLMDRADAHIIKYIHNGKEETMPDDKPEIISQDTQDVTVPAGTFQSIHVVAKTKDIDHVELWVNPRDTVMDGMLKMAMQQQGNNITIELKSFNRVQ